MTTAAVDRDLVLIQQDGLLLETVSRRRDLSAFSDEPIAALLAGLASEADRGGMAPAERYGPTGMRPPTHRIAPQPSRLSRHSGAVVLTVAALVVGSSGVAAAVTGDPFAPIKGMTHLVTGGADAGEGHVVAGPGGRKKGSLPETAAHVAVFTKKLTGVRPMLAKGDADAARDVLQSALADLVASGAPIPPGLQNRIDKLADRIDAVAATGDQGSGSGSDQGSGSGSDQGSGSGSDQGSGSGSG
ncbi:MAG: hypothetical protein OEW53_02825, partial [Actinomycetota bacterium]|nr:hypothetical protein [Actinomycetota bacterium]